MTCSARLPVYALLIAAFIPRTTVAGLFNLQGLVLFGLYAGGIVAALALGAQAVWIGTAFLVADEGELFDASKDQIVASDSEAFRISKIWTGKTVRAFHGEISQAWAESGLPTLETPHQRILMEDFLAAALAAGRHDLFYNIAGQAGGLVRARRPAKDIMADLVDGAVEQLRRLQRDLVVSLP